jgi:hypothetical protein
MLACDIKSLFLTLALLVSGGSYYAERFRIVAYGNSIISVSPTESAEALEACNFPMHELLAQARRTHPIRKRTLNK